MVPAVRGALVPGRQVRGHVQPGDRPRHPGRPAAGGAGVRSAGLLGRLLGRRAGSRRWPPSRPAGLPRHRARCARRRGSRRRAPGASARHRAARDGRAPGAPCRTGSAAGRASGSGRPAARLAPPASNRPGMAASPAAVPPAADPAAPARRPPGPAAPGTSRPAPRKRSALARRKTARPCRPSAVAPGSDPLLTNPTTPALDSGARYSCALTEKLGSESPPTVCRTPPLSSVTTSTWPSNSTQSPGQRPVAVPQRMPAVLGLRVLLDRDDAQ